MGDQCPILLRNQPHKCALHFHGVEMPRQPHPARKATHMGIHDNSLRQTKCISQNNICSFPTHPSQLMQLLHRPRNFSTMLRHHASCTGAKRSRFGSIKSSRVNNFLQLFLGNRRQGRGIWTASKEGRSDLVHPLVGALGGENGGNQQL